MRKLFFLALFALTACSTTPSEPSEAELAEATDECLSNPKLARAWGECNVKSTIYQGSDGIARCQKAHAKANSETLMLKIRLKQDGKVNKVWAEEGTAKNKPLEGCLRKEISKLQFAAPPKGVDPVIYFPFQQ